MSQSDCGVFKIAHRIDTILCDIEGTTTSISFVKDVLFPYVRANIKHYLEQNFESKQCQDDIQLLIEQATEDLKTFEDKKVPQIREQSSCSRAQFIDDIVANVYWQMDMDRKIKALKQIQGHMWRDAYSSGSIKGHVYDDVVPAFERWISKNIKIYIYSSGSVEAQKLLFEFSDKGNLLKYFSGHFDTNIGQKIDSTSYNNILNSLGKTSSQVLFLTDLIKEYEAATSAGLEVCLLRRPDNPDKETRDFKWVENFNQIE